MFFILKIVNNEMILKTYKGVIYARKRVAIFGYLWWEKDSHFHNVFYTRIRWSQLVYYIYWLLVLTGRYLLIVRSHWTVCIDCWFSLDGINDATVKQLKTNSLEIVLEHRLHGLNPSTDNTCNSNFSQIW